MMNRWQRDKILQSIRKYVIYRLNVSIRYDDRIDQTMFYIDLPDDAVHFHYVYKDEKLQNPEIFALEMVNQIKKDWIRLLERKPYDGKM